MIIPLLFHCYSTTKCHSLHLLLKIPLWAQAINSCAGWKTTFEWQRFGPNVQPPGCQTVLLQGWGKHGDDHTWIRSSRACSACEEGHWEEIDGWQDPSVDACYAFRLPRPCAWRGDSESLLHFSSTVIPTLFHYFFTKKRGFDRLRCWMKRSKSFHEAILFSIIRLSRIRQARYRYLAFNFHPQSTSAYSILFYSYYTVITLILLLHSWFYRRF